MSIPPHLFKQNDEKDKEKLRKTQNDTEKSIQTDKEKRKEEDPTIIGMEGQEYQL